jgi:hypothetical protein
MMPETQQGLSRAYGTADFSQRQRISWRSSFLSFGSERLPDCPDWTTKTSFAPIEGFGCDARHITSNRSKRGSESCQTPVYEGAAMRCD